MWHGLIYYAGPKSRWSGKVSDSEVIARVFSRWEAIARIRLVSAFTPLDSTKCGYVLMRDGTTVEQYDPPV